MERDKKIKLKFTYIDTIHIKYGSWKMVMEEEKLSF